MKFTCGFKNGLEPKQYLDEFILGNVLQTSIQAHLNWLILSCSVIFARTAKSETFSPQVQEFS